MSFIHTILASNNHHMSQPLTTLSPQGIPSSCTPPPFLPLHRHHQSTNPNTSSPHSICDLQEKFRAPIHQYEAVIATTQKLLRAAKILGVPVVATTQSRAKLGETCAELELESTHPTVVHADKTAFSMWVPEVVAALKDLPSAQPNPNSSTTMAKERQFDVVIVGIETHICVLQTTLDLLAHGHRVWIVQDGVSSCNPEEREVALQRLRQEGARVTTSESLIYEMTGDAGDSA